MGEPFEEMVKTTLPRSKPLRSEHDHLILQLHDCLKADMGYQKKSQQVRMPFPRNSVWMCSSDHALP